MRIQDVMTSAVIGVSPKTSISEAREKLQANRIHHLVVLEGHDIVGVLSDRDLPDQSDDLSVADVMTRGVATISPRATLRQAAGKMQGRTIGCLPVINRGKLTGIVTTSDLLHALATGSQPKPSGQRAILRKRGPRNTKRPSHPVNF